MLCLNLRMLLPLLSLLLLPQHFLPARGAPPPAPPPSSQPYGHASSPLQIRSLTAAHAQQDLSLSSPPPPPPPLIQQPHNDDDHDHDHSQRIHRQRLTARAAAAEELVAPDTTAVNGNDNNDSRVEGRGGGGGGGVLGWARQNPEAAAAGGATALLALSIPFVHRHNRRILDAAQKQRAMAHLRRLLYEHPDFEVCFFMELANADKSTVEVVRRRLFRFSMFFFFFFISFSIFALPRMIHYFQKKKSFFVRGISSNGQFWAPLAVFFKSFPHSFRPSPTQLHSLRVVPSWDPQFPGRGVGRRT